MINLFSFPTKMGYRSSIGSLRTKQMHQRINHRNVKNTVDEHVNLNKIKKCKKSKFIVRNSKNFAPQIRKRKVTSLRKKNDMILH